jgi:phage terminase large subunit
MDELIDIEIDEDLFLPCYQHLQSDTSDIRFLWGGRDSGKSQDIAMRKIVDCLRPECFREILIKKTGNSIKDSQWQTIKDICTEWGIDHLFNFTTHPLEITCTVNGNKFIARGCDDVGKLKSIRNPTGAWIEEGNQLDKDDWIVLLTTLRNDKGKVVVDVSFNPEADKVDYVEFYLFKTFFQKHYEKGVFNFKDVIETKLPDGRVAHLHYSSTHTTYKDNPHVTPQRIAFHESLSDISPYYHKVFTQGLWGRKIEGSIIYAHYKTIETMPDGGNFCYGLDFGYNHPTALNKVLEKEKAIYWRQEIYRSGMTTSDLIKLMNEKGIDKRKEIIADSAEPKTIEEIRRAGYNIHPADKSVNAGIDAVKSRPLFITEDSRDLLREIRSYRWKLDAVGNIIDDPVKFDDDGMDAGRYATYYLVKPKNKSGRSTVV